MGLSSDQAAATVSVPQGATGERRYLYGPVVDFMCLGGVTIFLLPVLFMLPQKELAPAIGAFALWLANVINHPHFAFSYQIFYEDFRHKAFGSDYSLTLRARYIFAGIVVPVALAALLTGSMVFGDARVLGYSANLMAFLVGWHYAKQGYGMLMVDAALKRQFFDTTEKKILVVNAYAVWSLAWLMANTMLSHKAMWGIEYYMIPVPHALLAVGAFVAIVTTVMAGSVLIKKWHGNGGSLPVNGVVAYVVTLYLWMLLMRFSTLALLVVPALHSLQYLLVASRYRSNRFRDGDDAEEAPRSALVGRFFRSRCQWRYAGFLVMGLLLGITGFWALPVLFQNVIPYDQAMFGATVFLFVFINVHHYFLDNVMWRSQNPDVRKYLFA